MTYRSVGSPKRWPLLKIGWKEAQKLMSTGAYTLYHFNGRWELADEKGGFAWMTNKSYELFQNRRQPQRREKE